MNMAQQRDLFLTVTLVAVVLAGTLALIGYDQYATDRDDHQTTWEK